MPTRLRRYRATRFDTFYLLGLIALSTVAQLLSGDFSPAITGTVPSWMAYLSAALLLLGSLITLFGSAWWGSNLTGLQIERIGRVTLTFPALGYGTGVLYYAHLHAGVTAALLLWLSVSCYLRAREIHHSIEDYYQDLRSTEGDW